MRGEDCESALEGVMAPEVISEGDEALSILPIDERNHVPRPLLPLPRIAVAEVPLETFEVRSNTPEVLAPLSLAPVRAASTESQIS